MDMAEWYLMRLRAFSRTAAGTSGGGVIERDFERRFPLLGEATPLPLPLRVVLSMISMSESESEPSLSDNSTESILQIGDFEKSHDEIDKIFVLKRLLISLPARCPVGFLALPGRY